MPELESNHKEADPQVMVHVEHTNRTYSSTIFPRPTQMVLWQSFQK